MGSGLALLLASLLGAWIGGKIVQRQRFLRKLTVARISPEDLHDQMRNGAVVTLVDLRHASSNGREVIPGALQIPIEDLEARHREIPRDRDIILFCS